MGPDLPRYLIEFFGGIGSRSPLDLKPREIAAVAPLNRLFAAKQSAMWWIQQAKNNAYSHHINAKR